MQDPAIFNPEQHEGLGNLLSQRIPNYRNLMNGYSALTARKD